MRYEVKWRGEVAARFGDAADALEFIFSLNDGNPSEQVELFDRFIGLPYAKGAVADWCRRHGESE